MDKKTRRIYVEKKKDFAVEAIGLYRDIKENFSITGLLNLRILNRYDIFGVSDTEYSYAKQIIFSEPPIDEVYDEKLRINDGDRVFGVEYLPGQYDQRADSASQCFQITTLKDRPLIKTAKLYILTGNISDDEFNAIKAYCINAVDSRECSLDTQDMIMNNLDTKESVKVIDGFNCMDEKNIADFKDDYSLAMSNDDLKFCQEYFKNDEQRNPSITEIRVIDTYWSDHCRHTTFNTTIENIGIQDGQYSGAINEAYNEYLKSRDYVYKDKVERKSICLMDIATIGMKELKKKGKLEDLDLSDEINACSIKVSVDVDGRMEEYLVMFKNETHNHPTEIEPFGGAATCLGGAIRDPLSGRAYVYQAMRVTGSGDPRVRIEDTIKGKLPQRKITTGALSGYSSYGNQIGLATGQVAEIYDEGFIAKRMEIGAVIGAVPSKNVKRITPECGDRVILLGGRTGRDGCGGATGSSKEHNINSIADCGAEVQKGNPPTERKIQRLFRNVEASSMIKKCNDFGAGGVSVAIGELADGLIINLDLVPKKYEGLDGTELAISESQERMAVVVSKDDVKSFISLANEENLEASEVAEVTADARLVMTWKGTRIVDIKRSFLDTNGVTQKTDAFIKAPDTKSNYFNDISKCVMQAETDLKVSWLNTLKDLNICSERGIVERFDSTIGAGTVLMPYGGKYQGTPSIAMAAKIPVLAGETNTGTLMSFGYNPSLSKWSPFHGALYAVIESVSKITASGGNHDKIRLTLQEYFEKLGKDPSKWGKPLSALLGAYYAQMKLGIPAIGGKDSMSGTFMDLNVPPTLVSFAVDTVNINNVISSEFKAYGSSIVFVPVIRDKNEIPDFKSLNKNYSGVEKLIKSKKVLSSYTVGMGGIAAAISKMSFGNRIGVSFEKHFDTHKLFSPEIGSIVLEIINDDNIDTLLQDIDHILLGHTNENGCIQINGFEIGIDEAYKEWEKPLENVFRTKTVSDLKKPYNIYFNSRNLKRPVSHFAKPKIFMPVFPGTNCEYDSAKAFEKSGGIVDTFVIKNLSSRDIKESMKVMADKIKECQIIMLPGGFSAGDEPDGSGKFIAAAFRNPYVSDAVSNLLDNRDGLILGICNGFQALIKLGLLPYGKITNIDKSSPTLTFNSIGRHVSRIVNTKIVSTLSPWFSKVNAGDVFTIPVSHGEGRFIANDSVVDSLINSGQIAAQYVDFDGNPNMDIMFNPNGSVHSIEAVTSADGRILGKMGHSERIGTGTLINILGEKDQRIFESGVEYFK